MNKISKTKTLFTLATEGAKVNIKCMYYLKTDHIGIVTFKSLEPFKHKKIPPTFLINKHLSVCSILKQHKKQLKNDPERLTTVQIFDIMEDTINGKIENEISDSISV